MCFVSCVKKESRPIQTKQYSASAYRLHSSRGRNTLTYASVTSSPVLPFHRIFQLPRPVRIGPFSLSKSKKMSNPTPDAKPGNADNPRVFFDVDIDGERGQNILFFFRKKLNDSMPLSAATCLLTVA